MDFLKCVITKIMSFFKTEHIDKSKDAELIEAFTKFFDNKDFSAFVSRMIELLGSPIAWSNTVTLNRLNYIIYIASKGKMLTLEDFMSENSKIIPTHIRIALGLFK